MEEPEGGSGFGALIVVWILPAAKKVGPRINTKAHEKIQKGRPGVATILKLQAGKKKHQLML